MKKIIEYEKKYKTKIMYGFNHRHHDSVQDAIELIDSRRLGKIINIRGVYGKSKIITFNQTNWRTKREVAGGGVLLDQGIVPIARGPQPTGTWGSQPPSRHASHP